MSIQVFVFITAESQPASIMRDFMLLLAVAVFLAISFVMIQADPEPEPEPADRLFDSGK